MRARIRRLYICIAASVCVCFSMKAADTQAPQSWQQIVAERLSLHGPRNRIVIAMRLTRRSRAHGSRRLFPVFAEGQFSRFAIGKMLRLVFCKASICGLVSGAALCLEDPNGQRGWRTGQ